MAVPTLTAGQIPNGDTWTNIMQFLGYGVVKAVGENLSATTVLQGDDELRLPFVKTCLYSVRATIIHSSNAAADFKFSFADTTGTVSCDGKFDVTAIAAGGGSTLSVQSGTLGTVFTGEGASADRAMLVTGWISLPATSAADGTLVVLWAQNTSDPGTTSVQAGSFLELRRLG